MKRLLIHVTVVGWAVFLLPAVLYAQSLGDLTGGSGNGSGIGSGGSGSGSGSSSGGSGGSSTPSTGMDNAPTSLEGTTDTPTFEGFQSLEAPDFVGVNPDSPFVGREASDRQSKSTSFQSYGSQSTSTRRTTSSRTTSSRTTGSRTGIGSNTGGREVRAATATDFAFSPLEVDHRTTDFRRRMTRLPNVRVVPDQVDIKLNNTPAGNVATLTGTVPTARDRKLVQQLLLLEPGIDKVDNRLVVSNTPATDASLPLLDPGAEAPGNPR